MEETISERRQESAGHQDDLRLDQLLEVTPAAVYTTDAEGLITHFNRRAKELWGRAPKLNDPIDRY
jgi:two-component system CheB/CheR fusion protein